LTSAAGEHRGDHLGWQHGGQNRNNQSVHADVYIALLDFNRRSIWPDFELLQVLGRGLLQGADLLARNEKACVTSSYDFNRIPFRHIAHRSSAKFGLGLRLAGSDCLRVLGI
jgi:hypothetical protein